jgi:hypothetical protein
MRRVLLGCCAACVVLLGMTASVSAQSCSSPTCPIGWRVTSDTPVHDSNGLHGSGSISGPFATLNQMETCLQQLVSGSWQTISNTCRVYPMPPPILLRSSSNSGQTGSVSSPQAGSSYAAWTWGYVNLNGTYQSASARGPAIQG